MAILSVSFLWQARILEGGRGFMAGRHHVGVNRLMVHPNNIEHAQFVDANMEACPVRRCVLR